MSAIEQIQKLLDCAVRVPIRDAAGVIIPAGVDTAAEAKAYRRCLKIAQEEADERVLQAK